MKRSVIRGGCIHVTLKSRISLRSIRATNGLIYDRAMLRQRQPERLRQVRDLRRRQKARVEPAQQQIELCGFFQFLGGEHRGFQRFARDHRAVIGEQHRCVFAGEALDGVGDRRIARPIIRHQRGLRRTSSGNRPSSAAAPRADRSPAASTAPPNASNADAPPRGPSRRVWYSAVCSGTSLVGASPEASLPVGVEPRQPGRVEKAERGIGRRHQIAAVLQPHADIARRARRQPALEQRAAEPADFLANPGFGHGPAAPLCRLVSCFGSAAKP